MRGRKPKPTNLKILDNTRSDRVNHNEPRYPVAAIDPPDWLTGKALTEWKRLAPLLCKTGVLTAADVSTFALLCQSYDDWRSDGSDYKAKDLYRRLSAEFGLTPSSRSRLKSTAEKPQDQLGAFLDEVKEA